LELNDTIDQTDLTDIYRVFHPAQQQHNTHSSQHPMHFLQNASCFRTQTSLNKYEKVEITSCVLSDYKGIKTRYQWLKKIFKHMETEQYAVE
jgi:acyl carrier protein phosphodiesterase